MNIGRIIERLANIFLRKAVNKGINAGLNHVARGGKDPVQMTPAERQQARSAREATKRARQAAKLTRRIGR